MAARYAPALFLEALAFWFVLRWLMLGRLILLCGRLLVMDDVVGVLGTLGEDLYVCAVCVAGAALLAWVLLRRWGGFPILGRHRVRRSASLAWRGHSATEVSSLCERRLGLAVDAAAPATLSGARSSRMVLALAGDGPYGCSKTSQASATPGSGAFSPAGSGAVWCRTSSTQAVGSGSSSRGRGMVCRSEGPCVRVTSSGVGTVLGAWPPTEMPHAPEARP